MTLNRVKIFAMDKSSLADINKCDDEFTIEEKLILGLENGEIRYEIVPLPATKKRYGKDNIDYSTYIDSTDEIVYLAYNDGQIAGQIILRKNWNNYAYIEDITVDVKYRRHGIGKQLVKQAQQWARESNLAGIMLETQDNNTEACRFYESCGFRLKGFDAYLYKGINRSSDEMALYWYWIEGDGE